MQELFFKPNSDVELNEHQLKVNEWHAGQNWEIFTEHRKKKGQRDLTTEINSYDREQKSNL